MQWVSRIDITMMVLDQGGMWASISTFMLMLATVVQGGALMAAFFCIERTATKHKRELKSWPLDMEVKAVGSFCFSTRCATDRIATSIRRAMRKKSHRIGTT